MARCRGKGLYFLRIVCFELDAKEEDGREFRDGVAQQRASHCQCALREPPKPMFLRRCSRRQSRMGARSPFLSQQLHYADAWYINRSTYLDPRHSRTYPRYPPSCGGLF